MKKCIHATISGKVQGVFFRDNTQKQAKKLAITGWVKNTEDGKVELMAVGDEDNMQQFITWLHKGPTFAKVSAVQLQEIPLQNFSEFEILR